MKKIYCILFFLMFSCAVQAQQAVRFFRRPYVTVLFETNYLYLEMDGVSYVEHSVGIYQDLNDYPLFQRNEPVKGSIFQGTAGLGLIVPVYHARSNWNTGLEVNAFYGRMVSIKNAKGFEGISSYSVPFYVYLRKNEIVRDDEYAFGFLAGARYANIGLVDYFLPEAAIEASYRGVAFRLHASLSKAYYYVYYTSEGLAPGITLGEIGVSVIIKAI